MVNPESRIKLIRSLEEIRLFEQKNPPSRIKSIHKWGIIMAYFVVAFFAYGSDLKRNILMLAVMAAPTAAYSIWLSFKRKLDERHKLLAAVVLELGSIAQEGTSGETVSKQQQTTVKTRKRTVKRKK